MRVVLGIDPGTQIVGYGTLSIEDRGLKVLGYGVIRVSGSADFGDRLRTIFEDVGSLIDRYRPTEVAIEEVFVDKNARSAIRIGEGRAAAALAAAVKALPIFGYPAAQVKKAVTGNGRAAKVQVQEMVRLVLGLAERPRPDDAADALAIAICHAHRNPAIPIAR